MILIRMENSGNDNMIAERRCLAIANCLLRLGETCEFITSNSELERMVMFYGFQTYHIVPNKHEKRHEIDILKKIIRATCAEKILIDQNAADEDYFMMLKDCIKTIYIDDYVRNLPAHMLIQYFQQNFSESALSNNTIKALQGYEFVPIGTGFLTKQYQLNSAVTDIMVIDSGKLEKDILQGMFRELHHSALCKNIRYHFVSGICSEINVDDFEERIGICHQNIYHYDKKADWSNLIEVCDFVVCFDTMLLYEMIHSHVPVITLELYEQHKWLIRDFEKRGMLINIGQISKRREDTIGKVISAIKLFVQNYQWRNRFSNRHQNPVDCHGAMRIAQEIIEF